MSETTMRKRVELVRRVQDRPPVQFSPEVLARVRVLKEMQKAAMQGAMEGMGDALRDLSSNPITVPCGSREGATRTSL
jgi:hypothetical protein